MQRYYNDWRDERIEQRKEQLRQAYKAYAAHQKKHEYKAFSPLEERMYDA